MSDIEHLTDRELLLRLDGELPDSRKAAADRHLAGCGTCRMRHAAIEDAGAAIAFVYHEESARTAGDFSARASFRAKLAAAAEMPRASWYAPGAGMETAWRALTGAALVGVAAMTAWLLLPLAPFGPDAQQTAPLPVAWATPGATWDVTAAELCAGTRHTQPISVAMRQQVLNAYGMERVPQDQYELDYLITPELGGATDARNLWPQPYSSPVWNARVKDELERLLPQLVCTGQLTLETAQRDMATDWVAAYKKYFKTDAPLRAHWGPAVEDDEDVFFADARQAPAVRLVALAVR